MTQIENENKHMNHDEQTYEINIDNTTIENKTISLIFIHLNKHLHINNNMHNLKFIIKYANMIYNNELKIYTQEQFNYDKSERIRKGENINISYKQFIEQN